MCISIAEAGVSGVVHAAGVDMYTALGDLTQVQLSNVSAPKIDGAINLQSCTASAALDSFVAFSSAATLFGYKMGSLYAAANSCLDSFVQCQRAAGVPAHSVQWGGWSEIGMAAGMDGQGYISGGVTNTIGVQALESIIATGLRPTVFVANMVWHKFLQLYASVPELLSVFATDHVVAKEESRMCRTEGKSHSLLDGVPHDQQLTRSNAVILDHITTQ